MLHSDSGVVRSTADSAASTPPAARRRGRSRRPAVPGLMSTALPKLTYTSPRSSPARWPRTSADRDRLLAGRNATAAPPRPRRPRPTGQHREARIDLAGRHVQHRDVVGQAHVEAAGRGLPHDHQPIAERDRRGGQEGALVLSGGQIQAPASSPRARVRGDAALGVPTTTRLSPAASISTGEAQVQPGRSAARNACSNARSGSAGSLRPPQAPSRASHGPSRRAGRDTATDALLHHLSLAYSRRHGLRSTSPSTVCRRVRVAWPDGPAAAPGSAHRMLPGRC